MAALALAPLTAIPAATANAQTVVRPSQDIVLSIGKGELINVPGSMSDVFIANDAIADIQIKSQRQLYLFGKSGGETTIYASNSRGDIIWSPSSDHSCRLFHPRTKALTELPEVRLHLNSAEGRFISLDLY